MGTARLRSIPNIPDHTSPVTVVTLRTLTGLRPRILAAFSVAALTGCGGEAIDLGEVTGVATGATGPVAGATVEFCPAKGRPSFATTGPGGRYELTYFDDATGAIVGSHHVRVTIAGSGMTAAGREEALESSKFVALAAPVEVVWGGNMIGLDLTKASTLNGRAPQGGTEVLERPVR